MTQDHLRAIDATRAILFSKEGGSPLHYVEAISLATPDRRGQHIAAAAEQLVTAPNPGEAAREIARSFLGKPPRRDTVPDSAEYPDEVMAAKSKRKASAPSPAPVPGQDHPDADEDAVIGPPKRRADGRRDVREMLNAVEVLALAVRMSLTLTAEVHRASTLLSSVAQRTHDRSAQAQLIAGAQTLRDAIAAAGTIKAPDPRTEEEIAVVDEALMNGQDVDKAAHFAREYESLCATGHAPSMSLDRFVALNLERLKKEPNR